MGNGRRRAAEQALAGGLVHPSAAVSDHADLDSMSCRGIDWLGHC